MKMARFQFILPNEAVSGVFECNAIDSNDHFDGIMRRFPTQVIACCSYRCSYLRFSCPFRPMSESATLFCSPRCLSESATFAKQSACIGVSFRRIFKFIHPKRGFWKEEQKMKSGFKRMHFSRAGELDLGYEPLKPRSNIRISSFVHPSKNFVWGAYNVRRKNTCEHDTPSAALTVVVSLVFAKRLLTGRGGTPIAFRRTRLSSRLYF